MILGKWYHGTGVDIWSSSIILYAMMCGFLPFEDPDTGKLYKKIVAGKFEIPKFISAEGRDLLRKLLVTDPDKRYSLEQIKAHPWFNKVPFQNHQGIVVG